MTEWLFVFKARSAARLRRPTDRLDLNVDTGAGIQRFSVRTRFTDEGHDASVPRELLIVARVEGDDYDALQSSAGTFASGLANIVAFATNAAVDPIELYVAVDATPGVMERRFEQQYGPLETGFVGQGRAIPIAATGRLVQLFHGPVMNFLSVGVHHYAIALTRWEAGGEVFVLSHLYTAAEAIEKTIAAQESERLGVPLERLHEVLGVPKKAVGPHYRRTVIFAGYEGLLKAVKEASDGFEHGSLSVAEVQERAKELAPEVFLVIRKCVLDRLGTPDDLRTELLSDRYRHPLDPSLRRLMDGLLLGARDAINAEGFEYPFLTWESSIAELAFDDNDDLKAVVNENLRVHIPEGAQFKPGGYRIFGRPPNPDAPEPPVRIDATVRVGREHVEPAGG